MFEDTDFSSAAEWPAGFARCPDELFEQAYESVSPAFRGAIKTALAAAFFHFGQRDARKTEFEENPVRGFWSKMESRPVDWALTIFAEDFNAPARLAAASVLPALCGVPRVGACSLGKMPAPALLATLELCGVEDVFTLVAEELDGFLQALEPEGRLIILHGAERGVARLFPCYVEEYEPRLYVAEPAAFDMPVLELAHGRAVPKLEDRGAGRLDCLYTDKPRNRGDTFCRLTLRPGLEAFWLLDGLGPDFFRARALEFGAGRSS